VRIACVLDVNYEDSEFKQPYDAFRKAGHEVTIIGLKAGKELKGKKGEVTTKAEAGIDQVRPDQFDALRFKRGFSRTRGRVDVLLRPVMKPGKYFFRDRVVPSAISGEEKLVGFCCGILDGG